MPFDAMPFDAAQPGYTASTRAYPLSKRIFDMLAVIVSLPRPRRRLIALLFKMDVLGTVLFRQKRIGANGKDVSLTRYEVLKASPTHARNMCGPKGAPEICKVLKETCAKANP